MCMRFLRFLQLLALYGVHDRGLETCEEGGKRGKEEEIGNGNKLP